MACPFYQRYPGSYGTCIAKIEAVRKSQGGGSVREKDGYIAWENDREYHCTYGSYHKDCPYYKSVK